MKLKRLQIQNFRNIRQMDFEPAPGINVIQGENAQGKTNLIEALWLFSGARSFRGVRDSELIRFGERQCRLDAAFFDDKRGYTAALEFGEKKSVYLNEIRQTSASELSGQFPMVVFSPIHLSLVKDGPQMRRSFLDDAIRQLFPTYAGSLRFYQKSLVQRNSLLRDAANHSGLCDLIDVFDQNLAKAGAQIIKLRERYAEHLARLAVAAYDGIAGSRERMGLSYECSLEGVTPGLEIKQLRALFLHNLSQARQQDLRLGTTTRGAHRDDLDIQIDGRSARQFGSQGQQRSCVLALKLAECGILEERENKTPIVLLDDVMSELDGRRREYLLTRMEHRQVFVTCCMQQETLPAGGAYTLRQGALESGGESRGEFSTGNGEAYVSASGTGICHPAE